MIFEIPKSEDLNSELSLEKTGCVITVRNCKHYNDDSARKLFPRSSAEYVSAETYTLPESYFSQSFWDSERERHQRVLNAWISNKNKLATIAPSEKTEDFKYVNCMACLVALINMYEWVLDMCWDGNRSKPPMPVQLYKARLSELKDANSLGIQSLHNLFCDVDHIEKLGSDLRILDMGDAPQCEVALMEHIDNILIALGKIANAGENVDEAFGVAMEIRHWLIGGKSCSDDLSKKLKFLNETVVQLENNVTEHTSADVDKKSIDTATVSTESSVSNGESYSDKSAHLSRSGRRRTGRRGRRPTRSAARDDDYVERRYPRSVVRYSDDDLISRVKRGQRTRRPARTFTPNWSLSPSPPPAPTKESTLSTKPATLARKVSSPLTKRTSLPSTPPITPTVLSPDSGRPSSNESTGNGAVNGKHLPGDTGQKDGTSNFEQCVTTPVRNLPSEAFLLPPSTSLTTKTTPLAPVALAPSTSFSTPVTTLSIAKAPQPPPLKLDEQSLLAIWKEKIELGDVRITLLNMLATNGTSHYHFIPLMLETIDKATAALDNKDMIAYAMHRAAIEVGCSELGNIMRSCNPADPTSQIATLATAMGLNPAPFTTMIQPSKMTTGLSPDVLVDLHEAATVVAAREKLAASSYTLPAQNVDNVQGYTERDITKYLL